LSRNCGCYIATARKTASEYTYKRLDGKFVDLEFEDPFRSRYGRLLPYVWVEVVADGYVMRSDLESDLGEALESS
jgi:hypothetical protein